MNKQKQEVIKQYENAISLVNKINSKISYCNGFIDHYNQNLGYNSRTISNVSSTFIFTMNQKIHYA